MERSRIGIVVPALNEEKTIADVVRRIKQYGQPIVVDDGSTDATAELAREAGAYVVSLKTNRGYDDALNAGFARAAEMDCAYIITIDADGQHNPAQLIEMIGLLESGYDLVLGVRSRFARVAESLFAKCANYLWGVADPMCGMKGYATSLYTKLGYFDRYKLIGSELAMRSVVNGCKVASMKVFVHDRIDAPRFGRKLSANYRIIRAMVILFILLKIKRVKQPKQA